MSKGEKMKYPYLLFDLDGTLTNPKEGITRCVQFALGHMGIIEDDPEKLTSFIGPPLIPAFMEKYRMTTEEATEALGWYRKRFVDVGIFENEVLDGIPQMLADLKKKGYYLAVASSKPEPYVIRILEKFDLLAFFDQVIGASMDEKRSEKKDIITEALRRIGIREDQKDKVLMIGDREHDVEGAKLCGIASLGVYAGFAREGELEEAGADYICANVAEMHDLLMDL